MSLNETKSATEPAAPPPVYFDARFELAERFLSGEGLEIGPLHLPLAAPDHAKVHYVDRMNVEELRNEYAELAEWDLAPVDIIDDGEKLSTVAEASQDFIIANHFLEHTEDPIGTIEVHLSKLKPGGILFYAVPDKRYTFDFRRPSTPLDHMVADHEQGPEGSRQAHYEEWTRMVAEPDEAKGTHREPAPTADQLEAANYSIHMHVWTQADFLQLILHCRDRFAAQFEIEVAARQAHEVIVVLRKAGQPGSALTSDVRTQRIADLERTIDDVTSSLSWRVTAPLRSAKKALRRRRG